MNPPLEHIIAKVLGIDPETITDEMSPATVERWDSFNGLMLVTELEKAYRVSFSIDEVTEVKNVGDIRRILKNHGVSP